MRKIVLSAILAFMALGFGGCVSSGAIMSCNVNRVYHIPFTVPYLVGIFFVENTTTACKNNAAMLKQACNDFEIQDKLILLGQSNYHQSSNYEIKDADIGLISVPQRSVYFFRDGARYNEDTYCNKLQKINQTSEKRKFAVNGDGANDFSVDVTKKIIKTKTTYKGKAINDNVDDIVVYEVEPIEIVRYEGRIYESDSAFIASLKQKYQKALNNLPCFELGGNTYCDGDVVKIYGKNTTLSVARNGDWKLYWYNELGGAVESVDPITGVRYMSGTLESPSPRLLINTLPKVIYNSKLKNQKIERTTLTLNVVDNLKLSDIKSFKEW